MARDKENLNRWQREYYQRKKTDPNYRARKRKSALKYYNTHQEQCKKSRLKYFLKNKEKYRKYRREWNYTSPYGIYSIIKSGLTSKKIPRKYLMKISKEDFVKWYNSQKKICFYCGRTYEQTLNDPLNRKVKRLTIDRIDNARGYKKGNLALACLRCNAVKNNYFTKDEMLKIGEIIRAKRT